MAVATSVHTEPIKWSCELHNLNLPYKDKGNYRDGLDYVHHELTHKNESEIYANVKETLADICRRYKETTGQNMQRKATPIRESVVVCKQDTTMEQVKEFARICSKRWGIKPLHISIHRDEGYTNAPEQMNYHAHIVWNWTDEKGKSVKLHKADCSAMQDLAATCLGMERGQSSTKQHLSALEYKLERTRCKLEEVTAKLKEQERELSTAKQVLATGVAKLFGGVTKQEKKLADEVSALMLQVEREKARGDEYYHKYNSCLDDLRKSERERSRLYTEYELPAMRAKREQNIRKNNGMEM